MSEPVVKIGMKPVHPGKFLREEVVEELGLTWLQAAGMLGMRENELSSLLNEETRLLPEWADNFEQTFGISKNMILNLQKFYEAGSF